MSRDRSVIRRVAQSSRWDQASFTVVPVAASGAYEEEVAKGVQEALWELEENATKLGADALMLSTSTTPRWATTC